MFGQPQPQMRAMPVQRQAPIMIPNAIETLPVQFSGLPQLVAHSVLDIIAQSSCLMVVQCLEPLEIFAGIETPNRYIIHDMFMRPILVAHERSSIWGRECSGNSRSFDMIIMDMFGQVFMNSSRRSGCCDDHLTTAYPPGNFIGHMTKGCGDSRFRIVATGCPEPVIIQSPCCPSMGGQKRFPVMSANGARIAEIVRLYPGFLQEMLTDADTYLLHFPPMMPVHLKLILLSAVFLIDFTYFEERA